MVVPKQGWAQGRELVCTCAKDPQVGKRGEDGRLNALNVVVGDGEAGEVHQALKGSACEVCAGEAGEVSGDKA